jgi:hypothetical protein
MEYALDLTYKVPGVSNKGVRRAAKHRSRKGTSQVCKYLDQWRRPGPRHFLCVGPRRRRNEGLLSQSVNQNTGAGTKSCSLLWQYEVLSLRGKMKGTNSLAYSTCPEAFYTTRPVEAYLMRPLSEQFTRYKG